MARFGGGKLGEESSTSSGMKPNARVEAADRLPHMHLYVHACHYSVL